MTQSRRDFGGQFGPQNAAAPSLLAGNGNFAPSDETSETSQAALSKRTRHQSWRLFVSSPPSTSSTMVRAAGASDRSLVHGGTRRTCPAPSATAHLRAKRIFSLISGLLPLPEQPMLPNSVSHWFRPPAPSAPPLTTRILRSGRSASRSSTRTVTASSRSTSSPRTSAPLVRDRAEGRGNTLPDFR